MEQSKPITRDEFDTWVFQMDDVLDEFLAGLPAAVSTQLDYSLDSLDVLEKWILENYPSVKDLEKEDAVLPSDSFARYIGETVQKNLGGYWDIDLENDKNPYYNLPVIVEYKENASPICPHKLVAEAAALKKGTYMKSVLKTIQSE